MVYTTSGDVERPHNLRTILLAYPKKLTKKFVPPHYIEGSVDSGVKPGAISGEIKDNWRLNELSKPFSRNVTEKYVFVEEEGVGTGISAATLAGQGTSRTNDLSRPIMRYLIQNKKDFKHLGNPFLKNIDKTLNQSWNSIYNYYKKSLFDIKKKREERRKRRKLLKSMMSTKSTKGKIEKPKTEKELKEERLAKFDTWASVRALPKKIPPPSPLPPRVIANMPVIEERMLKLAEPRHLTRKYLRASLDPYYVDLLKVPESAKTYEITPRVIELARPPERRTRKEKIIEPGKVKPSAFTAPVLPRFLELAVPKKKQAVKGSDLKAEPFKISKNALKYVATPYIIELAKPRDR